MLSFSAIQQNQIKNKHVRIFVTTCLFGFFGGEGHWDQITTYSLSKPFFDTLQISHNVISRSLLMISLTQNILSYIINNMMNQCAIGEEMGSAK